MIFRQMFDLESSTYTYLIADEATREAVLVDPVLEQLERDLNLVRDLNLTLKYSLETHVHADHVTAASKLKDATGCVSIVPENANVVCADRVIGDGEVLEVGEVRIQGIATSGHTDSHMAYLVNGNRLLTGDALLIRGCGRTDFQSGDAAALYESVTGKLFTLPDSTLVYPGHDYRGQTVSTIGEEKRLNPRFSGRSKEEFIKLMQGLNLPNPKRIAEAVPANERCGKSA